MQNFYAPWHFQSSEKITERFTKHFQALAPDSVTVHVTPITVESLRLHQWIPWHTKQHLKHEATFGVTLFSSSGVVFYCKYVRRGTRANTVLLGFGFDSDAIHSPDEHLDYGIL